MTKITQVKIKEAFFKLAFVVFYLVFASCKAQQIKTFDIKTFEKHKDHLNNYTFITNDSTVVKQSDDQYEYYETIQPKNSFFKIINRYHKNGQIKLEGQIFPFFFPKRYLERIR